MVVRWNFVRIKTSCVVRTAYVMQSISYECSYYCELIKMFFVGGTINKNINLKNIIENTKFLTTTTII